MRSEGFHYDAFIDQSARASRVTKKVRREKINTKSTAIGDRKTKLNFVVSFVQVNFKCGWKFMFDAVSVFIGQGMIIHEIRDQN